MKTKAAGNQKVNGVNTDKGKNVVTTVATDAESSAARAPSAGGAVGTQVLNLNSTGGSLLGPMVAPENEKGNGINADKGKSLIAPVAATDADTPLARAKAPADAVEKGGSASEANPVVHIRPPRPARRDYTIQEDSVKQWETPWNQQSPPPPPSQPCFHPTSHGSIQSKILTTLGPILLTRAIWSP